jgi:hypothetical protein
MKAQLITGPSNHFKLSRGGGSPFPPPPITMRPPPIGMTLLVLSDQNTEAHTSASIAFFAKLMEADHFSLDVILCFCRRRNQSRRTQQRCGYAQRRQEGFQRHGVFLFQRQGALLLTLSSIDYGLEREPNMNYIRHCG